MKFLIFLGEVNVVQVEAMTWKDSVKIPIATLTAGGSNSQVLLDLSFPDPPVTFSLIKGNGPVHIIGHHLIGSPIEEFDDMDEMEEEMIDDEEGEEGAVSIRVNYFTYSTITPKYLSLGFNYYG